jgi:hypothetical protein
MSEYFEDQTSVLGRTVRRGAEVWNQLDREEAAARRERAGRRRAATRRRNSHSGRVVTEVKVWPEVLEAALKAAGGDASRLRIVSDTEVWVD